MTFIENIAKQSSIPVGRTTLGKLLVASAAFLSIILVFGYVADEVLEGETQGTDTGILQLIHVIASPPLTEFIKIATLFGGLAMVLFFTVVLTLSLVHKRRWRAVAFTIFTMGGTVVTFTLLKLLFERHRPFLYNFVSESTYSFPSGHASLSCALALTLIVLTWHTKWRRWVIAAGAIYVIIIGFSRMYLAVHYPTDVLAGWLLASAWVVVVASIIGATKWPPSKNNL